MATDLAGQPKVVGVKQVRRALGRNAVSLLLVARDADPQLLQPLVQTAVDQGVKVEQADTMKDLGQRCGISVGAAVAALLR